MYGYVRPYVPELKVGEYERYKAVYCGLCRALGRSGGQTARMTLSYDLTFLCAFRMAVEGVIPEYESRRCVMHMKEKRLTVRDNPCLAYGAAASVLITRAKLEDDMKDEGGARRLRAGLTLPFVRSMLGKAEKAAGKDIFPEGAGEAVFGLIRNLSGLEEAGCPSADETAGAFGEVLSYIFSAGLEGDRKALAEKAGDACGRFIYICDAADDLGDDIGKHRYNPLAAGWGDMALSGGELSPLVKDSLRISLPLTLSEMGEAAEALDPSHPMTPIIKNIVYLGMPRTMDNILGKTGKKSESTPKGSLEQR